MNELANLIYTLPEQFYLVVGFSTISFIFGFLIGFVKLERNEKSSQYTQEPNDKNFIAELIKR